MFRTVILALEIGMIEPKTQVAGVHVIIDLEGLSLQHIWQFSPGFAKTILEFVQVGYCLLFLRLEINRFVTLGMQPDTAERHPHRQPAVHLQDAVQHFQAIHRWKAPETGTNHFLYAKTKGTLNFLFQLFFHGYERKSLHDKISPMCLPNRFGGLNDIVECPGPVLADILCRYSAEFECNTFVQHCRCNFHQ